MTSLERPPDPSELPILKADLEDLEGKVRRRRLGAWMVTALNGCFFGVPIVGDGGPLWIWGIPTIWLLFTVFA